LAADVIGNSDARCEVLGLAAGDRSAVEIAQLIEARAASSRFIGELASSPLKWRWAALGM
jgi:hypothetical protein